MPRALVPLLLAIAATATHAAPQALVVEATWTRFDQGTGLRYWHLGSQTRIESTAADKPDPYLLVDTAQDQRITVYRHNSSWRCDPLEPAPRAEPGMRGLPGRPPAPQPPPGIGPQGTIGPRTLPGGAQPTPPSRPNLPPMPEPPTGFGPQPQAPGTPGAPALPAGIGPQGPLGPRNAAGTSPIPEIPPRPEMPPLPARPEMLQPPAGFDPPAQLGVPPGAGPQNGIGPGAMPPMPGAGMGPGIGGGMPMPLPMGMSENSTPVLTKTEETQTLLGRTTVKYTIAFRGMETVEIWAVPDTDFGSFFAYRPQPPHRFGPIDLQDQWDGLLRREKLFPFLAIFRQGEREIARFTVTNLGTREVAEPAAFFAPPPAYYKSLPDPF